MEIETETYIVHDTRPCVSGANSEQRLHADRKVREVRMPTVGGENGSM